VYNLYYTKLFLKYVLTYRIKSQGNFSNITIDLQLQTG